MLAVEGAHTCPELNNSGRSLSMLYLGISIGLFKSSHRRCSVKQGVLRNFAKFIGKHLCQSLFFNKVAGPRPATLFKKKTLSQLFSCEFCKISKNIFFTEHLWATASEKIFNNVKM